MLHMLPSRTGHKPVTDVFISYASEDRDRADKLARALGAAGWSVWWDRKIITGQTFDQAIERELESAKSVVVLWSKHSIASEWVKNEAAVAAERGVLLPAVIDSVKPPLEFRRKQTAELIDWDGESSHSGFQALCEGVAASIGSVPLRRSIPRQRQNWQWSPRWTLAAIAIFAVALALGVYSMGPWRTKAPAPTSQSDSSESKNSVSAAPGLADLVVGTYSGGVIADSKGSSRSDIDVTVTKLDRSTVRVTSDYRRLGSVDVTLTRVGNQILNAGGDTPFVVDLDRNPPTLLFNPRNEVAYGGNKQK